jgi:hypothetical protein
MAKSTQSASKSGGKRLSEEQIIKRVIQRYGEVINLRETPFVLIEILRDFSSRLTPDGGSPPGGVGPVGPAGRIDNALLLRELLKIGREVTAIKRKVGAT